MSWSGGGNSNVTNEFKPPARTEPGWDAYVQNAQNIAKDPNAIAPYSGQTVADLSPMQLEGLRMQSDYSMQGSPERTTTGQVVTGVGQGAMNPFGAQANPLSGVSPYASQANPYMGDNPYLSNMIDTSNSKITQAYREGTSPMTDAASARNGAFGSSGWNTQVKNNEQNLLGSLASNTNALLKGNYDQSANLAEAGLNRGLSGWNSAAGLAESGLNRGAQAWQSGQANALQAGELGLGQQAADQSAISAMINAGQIPQQYGQNVLNTAQNYYQQNQQVPFTLQDFLGNSLSRASGGQGTSTYVAPGQSPWMGLLGGAAAAYPWIMGK